MRPIHFAKSLQCPLSKALAAFLLVTMLAACSPGGSTNSAKTNSTTHSTGGSKPTSARPAGQITEFALPTANGSPLAITSGPDNNLWFTESQIDAAQNGQTSQSFIGRITPEGKITEYPLLTPNTFPMSITRGSDGNLWFTETANYGAGGPPTTPYGGKIGDITPDGKMNEFLLPVANNDPLMITGGPDGNLWFTDTGTNQIGRISPQGKLAEFPLPAATSSLPMGITAGPDGNLWFTEIGGKIGRITPDGVIKEFPLPAGSSPVMIAGGPDGNLWFTDTVQSDPSTSAFTSEIGRITPTGTITTFVIPNTIIHYQGGGGAVYSISFGPISITKGSDGNLWFSGVFFNGGDRIGRITPGGTITMFPVPDANSVSYGISSAADGNIWFTDSSATNQIGRIATGK